MLSAAALRDGVAHACSSLAAGTSLAPHHAFLKVDEKERFVARDMFGARLHMQEPGTKKERSEEGEGKEKDDTKTFPFRPSLFFLCSLFVSLQRHNLKMI